MERQYALVFRGHRFGYEVQATAKLFLPGVRFQLIEDGHMPDCEHVLLTEVDAQASLLHVWIRLHGRQAEASHALRPDENAEYALCRLLYEQLQALTGYTPPWGMLTGIRPVRLVQQALDAGLTPEETAAQMQGHYLLSDEKMQLAMKTALVQRPLLRHLPEEIGLYISIPFCPSRCSYCSFVTHSIQSAVKLIPAYTDKLCQEIAEIGEYIRQQGLRVQSVYIGGGTPTVLDAGALAQIMAAIRKEIDLSPVREYTVEAGRADTITEEKLQIIRQEGATRLSVNPQTMQDAVLSGIGRKHTAAQTVDAFRLARAMGFDDINMDLIAGLPGDTFPGFEDSLRQVMALEPESITVHTLTIKRGASLYHHTADAWYAAAPEAAQMVSLAASLLPEKGWQPYYLYRQKNTVGNLENVGYARPGKESLYNILIMQETQTILGAGCGASTKFVTKDGKITRIMNDKYPYEYIRKTGKRQLPEIRTSAGGRDTDAEK